MPKKLEKSSQYEKYDTNNDGIVSDEEFAHMADIKKLEHDLRKQRAQRRMATASKVAMATFTISMFFFVLCLSKSDFRISISKVVGLNSKPRFLYFSF